MPKLKEEIFIKALKMGDLTTIKAFIAEDISWLKLPLELEGLRLPIAIAAESGHVDVISFLIKTDSSQLNLKDRCGQTAVIYAAAAGQAEVLKFLISLSADLQCATINAHETNGWTPLKWAMDNGHKICVEILQEAHCQSVSKAISENPLLLNMTDDKDQTILFKSTRSGHINAVKYLISIGADTHRRHLECQYTLFHIAVLKGHLALVQYLYEEVSPDYLHETDSIGMSAIIMAAEGGNLDVVRYLVEKGANLSLSFEGKTPIDYAVHHGHDDVVSFIILTLSAHQPIKTLLVHIQNAKVAIDLMEKNASFVPLFLNDSRINELILTSNFCNTTEGSIAAYMPSKGEGKGRRLSRYGIIDKKTGESTFFCPSNSSVGEGSSGVVRRLFSRSGDTFVVKSNNCAFCAPSVEEELRFMQRAYPIKDAYNLFFFNRTDRDGTKRHYRYVMPDFKGETFESWAIKEMSPERLAHVISLIANELNRLHEIQIIHGDLIPNNILVSVIRDECAIYFVDFGLAYPSNGKIIAIDSDSRYPPEREDALTRPSPRQDIYTLATTFKTIMFNHPRYDLLKLKYPYIHSFITESMNADPKLRPSLKDFCETLQREIGYPAVARMHTPS